MLCGMAKTNKDRTGLRDKAHRMLAKPGETVQMLARLGFGDRTPPTPRWALETRLRLA